MWPPLCLPYAARQAGVAGGQSGALWQGVKRASDKTE